MAQTPGYKGYTHLAAPRTVQVHAKLFYSAVGARGTGAARAKSSNTTMNPSHHGAHVGHPRAVLCCSGRFSHVHTCSLLTTRLSVAGVHRHVAFLIIRTGRLGFCF